MHSQAKEPVSIISTTPSHIINRCAANPFSSTTPGTSIPGLQKILAEMQPQPELFNPLTTAASIGFTTADLVFNQHFTFAGLGPVKLTCSNLI